MIESLYLVRFSQFLLYLSLFSCAYSDLFMDKESISDPLIIEKRRARFRLLGSILLTLLLFFLLPSIMDSVPPPRYKKYPIEFIFDVSEEKKSTIQVYDKNANSLSLLHRVSLYLYKKFNRINIKENILSKYDQKKALNLALKSKKQMPKNSFSSKAVKDVKFFLQFGIFDHIAQAQEAKKKLDILEVQSFIAQKNKKFLLRSGPYEDRQSARKVSEKFLFAYSHK